MRRHWSGAIKLDWMSSAVTKDVMSANEEPRLVLATSASSTPVALKGGDSACEASEMDSCRLLSGTMKWSAHRNTDNIGGGFEGKAIRTWSCCA